MWARGRAVVRRERGRHQGWQRTGQRCWARGPGAGNGVLTQQTQGSRPGFSGPQRRGSPKRRERTTHSPGAPRGAPAPAGHPSPALLRGPQLTAGVPDRLRPPAQGHSSWARTRSAEPSRTATWDQRQSRASVPRPWHQATGQRTATTSHRWTWRCPGPRRKEGLRSGEAREEPAAAGPGQPRDPRHQAR